MDNAAQKQKIQHPAPLWRKEVNAVGIAVLVFATLLLGLFFIDIVKANLGLEEHPAAFGATFSKQYASFLGLDWKEAYTATLDDLGVRRLRIPAYWDDIEPEEGRYSFGDLDWQIVEANRRGAKVILAIGRKLPRWPECHAPEWTRGLDERLVQTRILSMLETVVRRYSKDSTITAWQVENEPFLNFGECPPPNREFLKREVAVVRALDRRPVIITASGELSNWFSVIGLADVLGVSAYRVVWSKLVGYFFWPITPKVYTDRFDAVSPFLQGGFVSELQAEPWTNGDLRTMPINEQLALMNPQRLRDNVEFAKKIGLPEIYFWGVEWWYWLKQQGHPELWEAGKAFFR